MSHQKTHTAIYCHRELLFGGILSPPSPLLSWHKFRFPFSSPLPPNTCVLFLCASSSLLSIYLFSPHSQTADASHLFAAFPWECIGQMCIHFNQAHTHNTVQECVAMLLLGQHWHNPPYFKPTTKFKTLQNCVTHVFRGFVAQGSQNGSGLCLKMSLLSSIFTKMQIS